MRLSVIPGLAQGGIVPSFQFQSGAIKRSAACKGQKVQNWFQFQSGAIKRIAFFYAGRNASSFQFQSGAIKRPNEPLISATTARFNSNLVRLSGEVLADSFLVTNSFNSNLVRLSAVRGHCNKLQKKFQFQSGAIKRHAFTVLCVVIESFNSNLVRLSA